jgi:hypothetical protein
MNDHNKQGKPPKICLAASTGGHLTQLLRIEEAWREMAQAADRFELAAGEASTCGVS